MNKKRLIPFLIICVLFVLAFLFVPVTSDLEVGRNRSIYDYLRRAGGEESSQEVSILLGGDVLLGRTVMGKSIDESDYLYPFRGIADVLGAADITFVNLENPVFEGCQRDLSGVSLVFCAKPEMLQGLVYGGVDVVNLANNHTLNYGKDKLSETRALLAQKNIDYTGMGELTIKEVRGIKFGFLGFDKSQQANPVLSDGERELIIKSEPQVDVLVVAMHWGVEYEGKALPGVRSLAHELVSLGADVVVGHHPHWVQDWEMVEGKPVYYSLGNLVFDQMWSEQTKSGLLVKLTFKDGELANEEFIETYMVEWARPEVRE